MVIKKCLIFLFCIIFLLQLVIAQEYKIETTIISEDKIFESGETIELKITIRDSYNNIIEDDVLITLKDIKENTIQETTIKSKDIEEIKLDEKAMAGEGKIIVTYKGSEVTESFFVAENELAKFEINGNNLIITNIGNTKYEKRVYITIGETTGLKTTKINVGESISYRLVAPKGVYDVKVIEEGATSPSLKISEVKLTGTGQVIGALDERTSQSTGITGMSPEKESEGELIGYFKNSKFIYVFMLTIFGAMILLAIERKYRKKIIQ